MLEGCRFDAGVSGVNEPVRPEDMRASDHDRGLVQDRLRRAHELGQLDLHEYDERVRDAWAARTRGELTQLVRDLPIPLPVPSPPGRPGVFARSAGGVTMRVLTIVWIAVTVLNLSVWGVVSLTIGAVHPWWLWVAGPPGAVLLTLYLLGIGRPRRR